MYVHIMWPNSFTHLFSTKKNCSIKKVVYIIDKAYISRLRNLTNSNNASVNSKHDTFNKYVGLNAGLASTTLAQHQTNIDLV